MNESNEFFNERRETRFVEPDEHQEIDNSIQNPNINIEAVNFDDILQSFKSKDANIILSNLRTIASLINKYKSIDFMINYIYQIIDYLNYFIEIVDTDNYQKDSGACDNSNDEKLIEVSKLSMNILDQIFSVEAYFNPNSKKKESFFLTYIESISNPDQMKTCFSVINKMIDLSFLHKETFFESGSYDYLIRIPILQIPPIYLKSLTSIIQTCIKQDIKFDLPIETTTRLLHQLTIILENFQNFEIDILDQCARGCYNYVSINHSTISLFIVYNNHIKLMNAMPKMSDLGKTYSISALGFCFCCVPSATIPFSLLNLFNNSGNDQQLGNEDLIFDIQSKVINEIPLEIFKNGLELKDNAARADVAIALINVMFKVCFITDDLLKSGLFESMMTHFISDNFNIRVTLLQAFIEIYKQVPASVLPMFVNAQLFQVLEELVESDSDNIEKMATEVLNFTKRDTQHEDVIDEFEEFLFNRSL